jgi:hypothetical protein
VTVMTTFKDLFLLRSTNDDRDPNKQNGPAHPFRENAEPSSSERTNLSHRPSAGCLVRRAEGPKERPRKALLCIVITLKKSMPLRHHSC